MAIGTYEYESDDGTKYSVRMDEQAASIQGATAVAASNGIQPETIKSNGSGAPLRERYVLLEQIVSGATQGDVTTRRIKITICNPKNDNFLNGGSWTYKNQPMRITGAVGEQRTFFGD